MVTKSYSFSINLFITSLRRPQTHEYNRLISFVQTEYWRLRLLSQHLSSSSAAQAAVAARAVALGAAARLLLRLTELLLLLRVAGDDGRLGLVHRGHRGGDRGEGGRVRVGRALGGARGLAGGLALEWGRLEGPGRAAYYLALGVVLLGALLVAGLLAGGVALRGRGRRGGQGDRHL